MGQEVNYRKERIDRLLHELRYEVTRGMMEGDLDEFLGFQFVVPVSKKIPGGIVWCEFRTRPAPAHSVHPDDYDPKLKVVG